METLHRRNCGVVIFLRRGGVVICLRRGGGRGGGCNVSFAHTGTLFKCLNIFTWKTLGGRVGFSTMFYRSNTILECFVEEKWGKRKGRDPPPCQLMAYEIRLTTSHSTLEGGGEGDVTFHLHTPVHVFGIFYVKSIGGNIFQFCGFVPLDIIWW